MFEKIIDRLKSFMVTRPAFDPTRFNDPLALKTQWAPCKGGGTNICTHRLKTIGVQRMEFNATLGARFFYLIFLLVGAGVMVLIMWSMMARNSKGFELIMLMPLGVGLLFAIIGGALYYNGTKPVVFDAQARYFWKGYKNPGQLLDRRALKSAVAMDQIHALQIVSERCTSKNSSYYSYELNLVLKDAGRVNVVDHGSLDKLREDARALALFLKVPLWDATAG